MDFLKIQEVCDCFTQKKFSAQNVLLCTRSVELKPIPEPHFGLVFTTDFNVLYWDLALCDPYQILTSIYILINNLH